MNRLKAEGESLKANSKKNAGFYLQPILRVGAVLQTAPKCFNKYKGLG